MLDPDCGYGHGLSIGLAAMAGDWLEAAEHHKRRREIEAVSPGSSANYASAVLFAAGRIAEAIRLVDDVLAMAPAQGHVELMCAQCRMMAGDYDEARRHLATALLLGVRGDMLAVELVQAEDAYVRGAFEQAGAIDAAALTRELQAPAVEPVVRQVFDALAGRVAADIASKSAAELFEAVDSSGVLWRNHGSVSFFLLSQIRLGALDAAFYIARRMIERWRETGRLATGSLYVLWLRDLAPFRSDPRFQEVVRDLGLFPYWERYGPPDGHVVRDGKLIVL